MDRLVGALVEVPFAAVDEEYYSDETGAWVGVIAAFDPTAGTFTVDEVQEEKDDESDDEFEGEQVELTLDELRGRSVFGDQSMRCRCPELEKLDAERAAAAGAPPATAAPAAKKPRGRPRKGAATTDGGDGSDDDATEQAEEKTELRKLRMGYSYTEVDPKMLFTNPTEQRRHVWKGVKDPKLRALGHKARAINTFDAAHPVAAVELMHTRMLSYGKEKRFNWVKRTGLSEPKLAEVRPELPSNRSLPRDAHAPSAFDASCHRLTGDVCRQMYALFAIWEHMILVRIKHVREYWDPDSPCYSKWIADIMSCRRFEGLMHCMHFADESERPKDAAGRPLSSKEMRPEDRDWQFKAVRVSHFRANCFASPATSRWV